jgi:hypothetical protein
MTQRVKVDPLGLRLREKPGEWYAGDIAQARGKNRLFQFAQILSNPRISYPSTSHK